MLKLGRLSITHNFSNRNTTSNRTGHHQPWGHHIFTDIPRNLRGEHFLHPRRNVYKALLIFTILRRWKGPSPPFHPLLLFVYLRNIHNRQGFPFPLPLVNYSLPINSCTFLFVIRKISSLLLRSWRRGIAKRHAGKANPKGMNHHTKHSRSW